MMYEIYAGIFYNVALVYYFFSCSEASQIPGSGSINAYIKCSISKRVHLLFHYRIFRHNPKRSFKT